MCVSDEPQLMLTAGPSAMGRPPAQAGGYVQPGMAYGAAQPAYPGYGMGGM